MSHEPSNAPSSVGVVGAGPAGLAAALTLAFEGVSVDLYDARPEPGGRMRTQTLEGVRLDVGVQLLGSYYSETFALAARAGADRLLVRAPGRDALWREGTAHGVAYGSVPSMAASRALPAGLKLKLGTRYLAFLTRHATALDPNDLTRAAAAGLDRESIAEWGRREMGGDFVELLAYPQLAAYYGMLPEETSAGFYHALARAGLAVSVYAVHGGMGELARALVRALEERGGRLRTGVEVQAVRSTGQGVDVEWDDGAARHDAVIVATPSDTARAILAPGGSGGLDEPADAWLAAVQRAPAASLGLVIEGRIPAEYFGLSFPRDAAAGERVAALCVQGRKGAALDTESRSGLVVLPAPGEADRAVNAPPRETLERLLPAVRLALPTAADRIIRARVYRHPGGSTIFYPGYLEHLRRFDPDTLPARIALAGDYLVAPTVEGAVRSGVRAARRVGAWRG